MAMAIVLLLTACGGRVGSKPAGPPPGAIEVASFDFPESVILAQVYALALRAAGYPVGLAPQLGPREVVDPALGKGLVSLVPEYAGTALNFLSLGRAEPSTDPVVENLALAQALEGWGAVALSPAPAQDANVFAVTRNTAERFHLEAVSDLAAYPRQFTFGG